MFFRKAKAAGEKKVEVLPPEGKYTDLEILAVMLDSAFRVPGTKFRIGLDSMIGLIPGVGDAIGAGLSGYLLYRGARAGIPLRALLQMTGNVLLDTLTGIVPIAGDIFDAAYKSNLKNVAIIQRHVRAVPGRPERSHQEVGRLLALLPIILLIGIFALISAAVVLGLWFLAYLF